MAETIRTIAVLYFLSIALADDRILLTEEEERRWNTPPELIPEQLIKMFDIKNERSLTIPITTNINVNTGSSAHSLGFQVGSDGISYSESNSFNRPLSQTSGSVSHSQSVSFSAGLTGIAGAVSETSSGHRPIYGNVNNQAISFGSAAASSSGSVQNGQAATAAAASIGTVHSVSSAGRGMTVRFPEQKPSRPVWTNIRPNHNNGNRPTQMPKLDIEIKPHRETNRKPIMLHVSAHDGRWNSKEPKINIHKWQPNSKEYYDDEETRI